MFTEPIGDRMKSHIARGATAERSILIAGFMALFPGFFFYHFMLGTGRVHAFLGGYFSPVSLIFVLPFAWLYARQIRREPRRLLHSELYYALFLVFFGLVVAVNAANGANREIVVAHVLGIMFMANAVVMFKMIDFAGPAFRYLALLSLLGMTAVIVLNSVDGMFRMDALGMAMEPESLSTYQGFARSYMVTSLCCIAYTRRLFFRAVLYAGGAVSLYLNTARSEFVAFLFAIPIIEFYYARQKLVFVFIVAALAALINMNFDMILSKLPNNRILELLDLSQSNSAILRHHMMTAAIQTVTNYPVFGDYASYTPGHYAHNVLSAWVDLGLVGSLFLVALLIVPTISMLITGYYSTRDNGDFIFAFSLVCVTILLLVKSHYFSDMLIGAVIGTYSKYNYSRRYGRRSSADVFEQTPPTLICLPVPSPPPHMQ
jgi:hypothetical protein